ncbi:MAG: hypothetical protein HY077_02840 [Elusimicrobia bacterium]|nr:hypothetical protein [Elusimicrobiota bacterium]
MNIANRFVSVAALLVLSLASSAQAAPHGILWARGKGPANPKASGNLLYYGGPVISKARVTAVFWGPSVPSETQEKIGPFFSNILDSAYMDWLSEYDTNGTAVDGRAGTHQHIGRGSYAGSATIAPNNASTDLMDADVQAELESQIAAGKLPPSDDNTLYMVYFPAGINITIEGQRSCSAFCAYHEGFKTKSGKSIFYGIMPVCGGFGCGFGGAFDNMSIVSSHEAIEAITDPFPTPGDKPAYPQAWNTSDGQEIADLCQSVSGTVTGHGLTSKVSGEWDNASGSCLTGPWSQSARSAARPSARFKPVWRESWAAPSPRSW